MTDINDWSILYLRYPDASTVNYNFGTLAEASPFTVQVQINDADLASGDVNHGYDDAVLMGRDQVLGMDVIFSMTTTPGEDTDKWVAALDKVSEFGGVWRAQGMRNQPGRYATLTNNNRNRFAVGRPRNFSRVDTRARRGVIGFNAQFRANNPYWYASTAGDLVVPRGDATAQDIEGDAGTWPIIQFTGKFTTATLVWTPPGFTTPWTIGIDHALNTGEMVAINTAPWARSAVWNDGTSRNGWLSGDKLGDLQLFPSEGGTFLFTTTGSTDGSTKCEVFWHSAYAGL